MWCFKIYTERIDELRTQINKVESISVDIIELMLVTQYGDNSGNINWAELSKGACVHHSQQNSSVNGSWYRTLRSIG